MRLVAYLVLFCFVISGCSSVRTYTYTQDRVDQDMSIGNRGYVVGTPPPAGSRKGLKRTMFGVDVEVPVLWWEETELTIPPEPKGKVKKAPPKKDEKTFIELPPKPAEREQKKIEPVKKSAPEKPAPKKPAAKKEVMEPAPKKIEKERIEIKGEVIEDEDEWIK